VKLKAPAVAAAKTRQTAWIFIFLETAFGMYSYDFKKAAGCSRARLGLARQLLACIGNKWDSREEIRMDFFGAEQPM
jgi:hypothetical protein